MKILVAIDSSDTCKDAVKHLRMSGLSMGAIVKFVHVMPEGQEASEVSASLADTIATMTNAKSVDTLYAEGNPADRILELAIQFEADLIAVGTSDKGGIARLLLGSVSREIFSRAECPVLILRGEPGNMTNVLVAADDSEHSAACMEWLSNLSWARHKELVLLSVMNELPVAIESEFSSVDSASDSMLRKQAEELRVAQLSQNWSELCGANLKRSQIPFVVTDGDPAESILALSRKWPVDLIVMGSHSRTGVDNASHDSVSETVADKAGCSVLVVREVVATHFEEVRVAVTISPVFSRIDENVHQARVITSLSVNEFTSQFPSKM
jgi:Universal stress protein UspA and related nucleotide-binding proteins